MKFNYFKTIWVVFTCLIVINTFFCDEVFASDNVLECFKLEDDNNNKNTNLIEILKERLQFWGNSNKKKEFKETISISDGEIPNTNEVSRSAEQATKLYGVDNSKSEEKKEDDYSKINYMDEYYAHRLEKNAAYTILFRDTRVRDVLNRDEGSKYMEGSILKKEQEVILQDFADTKNGKYVILKSADDVIHYEKIEDFYNNSYCNKDGIIKKYIKEIICNAYLKGKRNGVLISFLFATVASFSLMYTLNYMDSKFLSNNSEEQTAAYLEDIDRITPGAMLASIVTIVKCFDENAIPYLILNNFKVYEQSFKLSQWSLKIVCLVSSLFLFKILFESFRCYSLTYAFLRVFIWFIINLFVFYIFNILSWAGVLCYTGIFIYQNIFYSPFFINESAIPETNEQDAA